MRYYNWDTDPDLKEKRKKVPSAFNLIKKFFKKLYLQLEYDYFFEKRTVA